MITASYTGTSTAVAGFGSANFQPTISNWHTGDVLFPIRQGANAQPPDGSGVVQNQFYTGSSRGDGPHVVGGAYVPGTYGRVYPMARVPLAGSSALQGFVHTDPDGSGQTYLRIAQSNNPDWIGQGANTLGTGGVLTSQPYVAGRTFSDPDFWGNRDTIYDPDLGQWDWTSRIAGNDIRRVGVELFRFAFVMGNWPGSMIVDVPLAGQQRDANGNPYVGYYSDPTAADPDLLLPAVVQVAQVSILPGPGTLVTFGALTFGMSRRRRVST